MIASLDTKPFRTLAMLLTLGSLVVSATGCAKGLGPKPTQPPVPIDFALAVQYAQRAALVYETDASIKQKSP
ncbi:MAG: hypothetical protein AAB433_01955, partial [Nitrospirota bacterium]